MRRMRSLVLVTLALPASVSAQQRAADSPARFERTECFAAVRAWAENGGLECGWLTVPEVHARPNGPTVRLAVMRWPAKNPTGAVPIVYLHGGPGGIGTASIHMPTFYETLGGGVRDVIVFDQRAVGLSEPKLCPDVVPAADSVPTEERHQAFARQCIASIRSRGHDPAGYTTPAAADDVRELRRALGYEKWDLYGISYGGRLAFETMRRDPDGIRAVVVGSPAIPVLATLTEDPISVQQALERLFATCAGQPACRAAFPTVAQDFHAIYDSLARSPLDVQLAAGGSVRFDGVGFLSAIRCQLANTHELVRIPLLLHELRRGERVRAASVLVEDCFGRVRAGAAGMNAKSFLINCYEYGTAWRAARAQVRTRVQPMWWVFEEGSDICALWHERFADSVYQAPVHSDIPTLILTGEFDERTTTEQARRGAVGLTRHYLYEIPGESHGNPATGCHAAIIQRFLENPYREPDTSCIASMAKVAFATSALTVPNLVFTITADAAGSPFTGHWETEIPSAPRRFDVELKIEAGRVSGMWNPNRLEIFDGVASADTLRFRLRAASGARTITFTATLRGDTLAFVRDVVALPGNAGGQGIFGAEGVRSFTATRTR